MKITATLIGACAFALVGAAGAYAAPCTNAGTTAAMKDAGSGPTPGNTGQAQSMAKTEGMAKSDGMAKGDGNMAKGDGKMTTGSTTADGTAGTPLMNETVGDKAASPADVRAQTAGQPTAAQQAQGTAARNDC